MFTSAANANPDGTPFLLTVRMIDVTRVIHHAILDVPHIEAQQAPRSRNGVLMARAASAIHATMDIRGAQTLVLGRVTNVIQLFRTARVVQRQNESAKNVPQVSR